MKRPERVWIFDENRRVYAKDANGKSVGGGPIWREHWREEEIVDETPKSWVARYGAKIPKKDPSPSRYCFSEDELNRKAWVQENRHRIADALYRVDDYDALTQVAALIGYQNPNTHPTPTKTEKPA